MVDIAHCGSDDCEQSSKSLWAIRLCDEGVRGGRKSQDGRCELKLPR